MENSLNIQAKQRANEQASKEKINPSVECFCSSFVGAILNFRFILTEKRRVREIGYRDRGREEEKGNERRGGKGIQEGGRVCIVVG